MPYVCDKKVNSKMLSCAYIAGHEARFDSSLGKSD